MSEWVLPAGSSADGEFDTRVSRPSTGSGSGLAHTGLLVTDLTAGVAHDRHR